MPRLPSALLAAALALLAGCAPTLRLAPQPAPGQEVVWLQGRQAFVTGDGGSTLSLHAEKGAERLLKLTLTVRNVAWPRLDVVPTALSVTGWRGGKATPMTVWDPADYVERQRRFQAFTVGALAVANVLAATQDGQRTTTSTRVRAAGRSRPASTETTTATTYDSELAARQTARRMREFTAMANEQEQRNAVLEKTLLQATTLRPGESVSGQVFVEFEDADGYQVRVPLGNRTHVITLAPVRR